MALHWFHDKKSPAAKKAYLDKHPKSRMHKQMKLIKKHGTTRRLRDAVDKKRFIKAGRSMDNMPSYRFKKKA